MFWTSDDGTIVNTDHIVAIRPEENGIVTLHVVIPGVTIDLSKDSFIRLKLALLADSDACIKDPDDYCASYCPVPNCINWRGYKRGV